MHNVTTGNYIFKIVLHKNFTLWGGDDDDDGGGGGCTSGKIINTTAQIIHGPPSSTPADTSRHQSIVYEGLMSQEFAPSPAIIFPSFVQFS